MISSFISSHFPPVMPFCEKQATSGIAEPNNFAQQRLSALSQDRIGFWSGHSQIDSRQCANMTEFIHTYIHPPGQHADGTPMSDQERLEEREFNSLVDSMTGVSACKHATMAERSVKPFRLNGLTSMLVGLVYILSGTGTAALPIQRRVDNCRLTDDPREIAFCQQARFEREKPEDIICSYADDCPVRRYPDASFTVKSTHSVCQAITNRHPMIHEFERINESFRDQLSPTINLTRQEKIIRSYRSMSFDRNNRQGSNVALILSGGTRATAQLTKENHAAYARLRGINYRFVYPFEFREELGTKQLYWMKVFALKNALECEEVPAGQWVVWLDDDIVINDFAGISGMLDRYIEDFGNADLLVAGDNRWVLLNTGIILVKKTEKARSFLHMWSLYSNDLTTGYKPQKDTLHEQYVLKYLIERAPFGSYFSTINKDLNLIKIVPNRVRTEGLNLNTYKRETFVKQQPWYDQSLQIQGCDEEQEQGYEDGDGFIHLGTKLFRTRLIMETLQQPIDSYQRLKETSQQ